MDFDSPQDHFTPSVPRVTPDASVPSETLRQQLRGFPEPAVAACARFLATRTLADFLPALHAVIEHHLARPAAAPVGQLPGGTRLVADLGLDSVTLIELSFLCEDVFGATVPQEELARIVTLDDLRQALQARLNLVA